MLYTSDAAISSIVNNVRDDIYDYIDACLIHDQAWFQAQQAVINYDPAFPRQNTPGEFIEAFLPWIEVRKAQGMDPWQNNAGQLSLNNTQILTFLQHFQVFVLERMICSDTSNRLDFWEPHGSDFFENFITFVAECRLASPDWVVTFQPDSNYNLGSFVSWLIVDPIDHILHVVYDRAKIQKDLPEKHNKQDLVMAYEKIRLHELGHARNELNWYLGQPHNGAGFVQASSRPEYECFAWVYGFTVRSAVQSLLSRITRIRFEEDNLWCAH